jgi:hypothetical protein
MARIKEPTQFVVYLKGREKAIVVTAEQVVSIEDAKIEFRAEDGTPVAVFYETEVQGWERREDRTPVP